MSFCWQDCVVILAPYLNNPDPVESFNIRTDFDIQGNGMVWYARPQLFFNCTLCPTGAKGRSGSHKEVSLVYFSTFEPIKLTPNSVMQRAGVPWIPELLVIPTSHPDLSVLKSHFNRTRSFLNSLRFVRTFDSQKGFSHSEAVNDGSGKEMVWVPKCWRAFATRAKAHRYDQNWQSFAHKAQHSNH